MANPLFQNDTSQPQNARWLEWAIPAAVSLVGSIFSTSSSNAANKELVEQQNEFNEKMIDKQNEYNSPLNQKRLYEQAGVSPAFLFGGQSGLDSTSGAAQSSGLPQMQGYNIDGRSAAELLFESKRLQNETLKNEVDIKETITKTESYKLAMEQSKERFNKELAEIESRTYKNDAERNLAIEQLKSEQLLQQQTIYNTENLRYQSDLLQQRAITEGWNQKVLSAQYDKIIKSIPLELQEIKSSISKNYSSAKLDKANVEVAAKTIEKINSDVALQLKQGRSIDANMLSVMIENAIKEMDGERKEYTNYLKDASVAHTLIYETCNGMLGDVGKVIASFINQKNITSPAYNGREYSTSKFNERVNSQSSFIFSE